MKVIDLLNKIANGEEVPKRIKYKGKCWHLKQNYTNTLPYYSNGYNNDNLFTGEEEFYFSQSLNDEIELIEDKKIEKIKMQGFSLFDVADKVNEIIDKINAGVDKE